MLEYIEFPNSFMDMGSCGNSILGRIAKMEVGKVFVFTFCEIYEISKNSSEGTCRRK